MSREGRPDSEPGRGSVRLRQVFAASLLAAGVVLSSLVTLDEIAEEEFEGLFQRALTTFALARALNGVISAVQGTEIALQPAGVGMTLTPGEILDPVNDLVERFSWVMMGATISLGIQQVLMDMGQWWVVRVMLAGLGVAWFLVWSHRLRSRQGGEVPGLFERTLFRSLVIVLFIRFTVPVAFILNEAAYGVFLESQYTESVAIIEAEGTTLQRSAGSEPSLDSGSSDGISSMLGRVLDAAKDRLEFDERLQEMKQRATELVTHVVRLSVVFILQTGVFPIFLLWALVATARRLLRLPAYTHS